MRDSIIPSSNSWNNYSTTNCYAYALNCDVDENKLIQLSGNTNVYNVGGISEIEVRDIHNQQDLEKALYSDLKILDIDIDRVTPDFELERKNEWLISMYQTIYYAYSRDGYKLFDFHFCKKNNGQSWGHKKGLLVLSHQKMISI